MSLEYKERILVTGENRDELLVTLGLAAGAYLQVLDGLLAAGGQATISFYRFCYAPSGPSGELLVCHDTGKAAINSGGNIQWGEWGEDYETLTLADGEKFNYEGKPAYEGDDGACSLGNV